MTTVIGRLALLLNILVFVGCGKRPAIIENLRVTPQFEQGDVQIKVETDFNLGGMELLYLSLPIYHPRSGHEIGEFTFAGKRMSVAINLTEIANLNSSIGMLPNGTMVPFVNSNHVVEIPIGQQGIRLYVSWTATNVVMGVAIPIRQFDGIGQTIGQVNLLPVFQIGEFQGAAGTFHSRNPGQNGIAFFVDLSSILPSEVKEELFVQSEAAYLTQESRGALRIQGQVPKSQTEAEIGQQMQTLSRRKTKLTVR